MSALSDSEIRAATHRRLLRQARACAHTLIVDELGLAYGANRVDIAVINGHIRGIEIKSEGDTLKRLPKQVEAYSRVVDRACLIAAEQHISAAEKVVPDWWGIMTARRSKSGFVVFSRLRTERLNHNIDPAAVVQLLWRPEIVSILITAGFEERALRRSKAKLCAELVNNFDARSINSLVRNALKCRKNWRDRSEL